MITLNLAQATQLLAFFGGEDAEIDISQGDGHSGPGLYAAFAQYHEAGSLFLDGDPKKLTVPTKPNGDSPLCSNCENFLSTPSELAAGECKGCSGMREPSAL